MPIINPLMNPKALTEEERSYLLGLYLTDGYLCKEGKNGSRKKIYYFLQLNEVEIADEIVSLFGKALLKPHAYRCRNTIRVVASSANLDMFYPNKAALMEDPHARRRFLEDNHLLLSLEDRVAFCAGLLDGDGSCKARLAKPYPAKKNKNLSSIGSCRTHWSFCQIRYSFLVDYFREFVESLAPDSTGLVYRRGLLEGAYVRRSGREALLKAGIARWSWKVRKWVESIHKLLRERRRVRESEERKRAKEIADVGMRLVDLAKALGLRKQKLAKWYRRGSLQAKLVREGAGIGYLVIPWEEVERVKARLGKQKGDSLGAWSRRLGGPREMEKLNNRATNEFDEKPTSREVKASSQANASAIAPREVQCQVKGIGTKNDSSTTPEGRLD